MSTVSSAVAALAEVMAGRRTLAVTGAGISTDSGIPDYRGVGTTPIEPVDFQQFTADPVWYRWVWARNQATWRLLEGLSPTPGHLALARLEEAGCSRYVVTDVARDGTLQGPNLDLLASVAEASSAPVVASGGVARLEDLRALRALVEAGVDSAIVGKALYAGAFTLAQAIEVANAYAAEHLEIHTADAPGVARRIRNAGAIFVGPYSPVPLGDYLAGSNHVLPTGGTARFAAGLSVMAFLKPVQLIEYSASALESMTPALEVLASCEDLPAHGEAARARRQ